MQFTDHYGRTGMRRITRPCSLAAALLLAVGGSLAAQESPDRVAQLASNSVASRASLLERRAGLVVRDTSLAGALDLLGRRSGVALAYSPSLLPADLRVTCECQSATVGQALERLLVGAALSFRAVEGQIVIVPERRSPTAQPEDIATASEESGTRRTGLAGLLAAITGRERPDAQRLLRIAVITGTVTSEGNAPLQQALVTIPSLQLSATTNDAGTYRIVVPTERVVERTDTLRVTRLGFRPENVPFELRNGEIVVNVEMTAQVLRLDQVVVTGTAGMQERRTQPAVISTIDASDIVNRASVANPNELLTARTPGVSLTTGSGASGSNTRINIRGQASVTVSNQPLVFIDGVRVTAGSRGVAQASGGASFGTGGQQFNALNDINPNDIESIEVVKGPAAATLYGADASAGVIQIITKKGRVGTSTMTHTLNLAYENIDPNFTPPAAYARCTAAMIVETSAQVLCHGLQAGDFVSDNVLARNDAFDNGGTTSLQYSVRGGGQTFGYFASFGADDTEGTVTGNNLNHRTGRVNLNWNATDRLNVDVGLSLIRAKDRLPQGDQSTWSFNVQGFLASPLSVREGPDGGLTGGFFSPSSSVESITSIITENTTIRTTPSVRVQYTPLSWLTNRLTLGADLGRVRGFQFYPRNDLNWYSGVANQGSVARTESYFQVYTVDYLGSISHAFGEDGSITSELAFGSQFINQINESVSGQGNNIVSNSVPGLTWAVTATPGQGFGQEKTLGFFVQEQLGFNDRLFLQVGARVDRNSAFGADVGTMFLPKVGVSWIVSEQPFWQDRMAWLPTLRLRGAYGTTGRAPNGVAALQTFSQAFYVNDAGVVFPGVAPGNPGNPNLEPEKGTEIEAGFDAGLLDDRIGIELTYFRKVSTNLLFPRPIAPSAGFTGNPIDNLGEVSNSGLEVLLRATPIDRGAVYWETSLAFATLRNRIEDLGDIEPQVTANNQCLKAGIPVAAWCVPRVIEVDTVRGITLVSDTAEYVGTQLPKLEGTFSSTLTLFRDWRIYAQVDGKFGHKVYNLTRDFRDRTLGTTKDRVLTAEEGGYSDYERLRRFGPFRTITDENNVGAALVRDPYIVEGDFVRFRELTLTWSVPGDLFERLGLSSTSISLGAKNIGLWTKYDGYDPEIFGVVDQTLPYNADVFTTPPSRRFFTRVSVQF